MKRAVVVTHSSTYEERAELVGHYLQKIGCEVQWVYADFDHHKKINRSHTDAPADHVYLPMEPYYGNLSVKRIRSLLHYRKTVRDYLKDLTARSEGGVDLYYFLLPLNGFAQLADEIRAGTIDKANIAGNSEGRSAKECSKSPVIIYDILDLWPESLPIDHLEWLPPIKYWKSLRDKHLKAAAAVITECSLFQQYLPKLDVPVRTLYWVNPLEGQQKEIHKDPQNNIQKDLGIAYVGSISHIMDMDGISQVLQQLQQKYSVTLHIIGDGDCKQEWLEKLKQDDIPYIDHGIVFDDSEKSEIYKQCRFGINMMKSSVKVGLTMKSIDYLAHGLPLINSIPGDTWDFVEKDGIGVNVQQEETAVIDLDRVRAVLDDGDLPAKIQTLYDDHFTVQAFENGLKAILDQVI